MLNIITPYTISGTKYYRYDEFAKLYDISMPFASVKHYVKPVFGDILNLSDAVMISEKYADKLIQKYSLVIDAGPELAPELITAVNIDFQVKEWQEWISEAAEKYTLPGFKDQFTEEQKESRQKGFKKPMQLIMMYISPSACPYVKGIDRDLMVAQFLAGLRVRYFGDLN